MKNIALLGARGCSRKLLLGASIVALIVGNPSQSPDAADAPPGLEENSEFFRDFRKNPKRMKMYSYIPSGVKAATDPRPLVVLLHGCGQTAADYFEPTGWKKVADDLRVALLLPEQQKLSTGGFALSGNAAKCFTWWETDSGNKEPVSIINMIKRVLKRYPKRLDPNRIFVSGLSAGAGMTVNMAALYPGCFAGAAPIAGLPFACAEGSATKAMGQCMLGKPDPRAPPKDEKWKNLVTKACKENCPTDGRWPRMSIWQGAKDSVVNLQNMVILMHQWTKVHGIRIANDFKASKTIDAGDYQIEHSEYGKKQGGDVLVETWLIKSNKDGYGAQHVVPIKSKACGSAQTFIAEANICSSRKIAEFFKLSRKKTAKTESPGPLVKRSSKLPF